VNKNQEISHRTQDRKLYYPIYTLISNLEEKVNLTWIKFAAKAMNEKWQIQKIKLKSPRTWIFENLDQNPIRENLM
jgi:hypothetical protein